MTARVGTRQHSLNRELTTKFRSAKA
jgi:hypothetical protein